jgi:hypothetical protein
VGLPDYQPFRAPRDEIHDPWFARMSNPEDSPRYWRKWLQARGISDAIERQVSQHYRSLRRSFERMWTITYAGTVTGALLGVIVSVLCARAFTAATLPWVGILLLALGAPLLASLLWWGVYLTARRRQGRSQSGLVPDKNSTPATNGSTGSSRLSPRGWQRANRAQGTRRFWLTT